MSEDQDWRLEAELHEGAARGTVNQVFGRLRGPNVVKDAETAVPHDVVVTHDGKLLFAYASTEAMIAAARRAIEEVLRRDGLSATIRVGHWDDEFDVWRQTDPPLTAEARRDEEAAERGADAIETRTMVASSEKLVRAEFERSMLAWADKLGIQCAIIEHPHLLTTQVAFTVTGPKHKIDEFSRGLLAEGWASVRAETGVMLSPL